MQNKIGFKFTRSILGRMLMFGVAPTVLILLVIIIFTTTRNYNAALVANESLLAGIASKVSTEIERGNTRSVVAVKTTAHAQENGLFGVWQRQNNHQKCARQTGSISTLLVPWQYRTG